MEQPKGRLNGSLYTFSYFFYTSHYIFFYYYSKIILFFLFLHTRIVYIFNCNKLFSIYLYLFFFIFIYFVWFFFFKSFGWRTWDPFLEHRSVDIIFFFFNDKWYPENVDTQRIRLLTSKKNGRMIVMIYCWSVIFWHRSLFVGSQ